MSKKILITAGGELSSAFLLSYMREHPFDYVIAADRGMDVLREAGIVPDMIMGDFDSTRIGTDYFAEKGSKITVFPQEKDFSDMEAALNAAVEAGASEITVLGAAGGRLDHFLANVMALRIPLRAGIGAYIVDEQNRISLRDSSFIIKKRETFGKYVSLLPLAPERITVSLRGFKYDGEEIVLSQDSASLGISNEPGAEEASVRFDEGIVIVVESMDEV
ncbi:MAG: thiamine diphosphokinase [Lachnospiraceae bacterium]|nr:thiamine diphosphokinase [Lachnospiraceae bacterium]